jgi:hypothetical protein
MSINKLINLDQEKQNENVILDDYLDLIRCSYPHCICGKCITKKLSHISSPNYKYSKNINSIYKKDFNLKEKVKKEENEDINRNIKLHEKNTSKSNHLKHILLSTMKKDFNKNSKTEENLCMNLGTYGSLGTIGTLGNLGTFDNINTNSYGNCNGNCNNYNYIGYDNNIISNEKNKSINEYKNNLLYDKGGNNINNYKDHLPFIGRSNYDSNFPDWQLEVNLNNRNDRKPKEHIPFKGSSDYKDKFIRHENIFYLNKRSPILNTDHLENKGEMRSESTFKDDFKPITYQEFKDVNETPKKRQNSIIWGPYCKNSFLSSYKKAFMYNNLTNSYPNSNKIRGASKSVSVSNNIIF